MKKILPGFIATVLILQVSSASGGDRRPIVAVFDIEAKRLKLSNELLDELGDHLATRLTETGKYQVVPRSELKKRLLEEKKKTYKACYDEKCQIEMGRELAAEMTLSAKIVKLGKNCKVNVTIYDLKKAATESAASVSGTCGEDGIVESLEKAVRKLVGSSKKNEQEASSKDIGSKSGDSPQELYRESVAVFRNDINAGNVVIKVQNRNIVFSPRKVFSPREVNVLKERSYLLDKIAVLAKKYQSFPIVIASHTDSAGDAAANKSFTKRRAQSVFNYMVNKKGLKSDRIKSVGYGEEMPIADNKTEEGRAINRRLEIIFVTSR